MAKDFDDFVKWYSDRPDKSEWELTISNELLRAADNGNGATALYTFMQDIAIDVLRGYLEWSRG